MPGFYMECYAGLKWVKESIHYRRLPQKEVLLTGSEIEAKTPGHSGDSVLGEDQLYALPLMPKG